MWGAGPFYSIFFIFLHIRMVGTLTAIGDVNRSIAIGSTPMERTSRYVTLPK